MAGGLDNSGLDYTKLPPITNDVTVTKASPILSVIGTSGAAIARVDSLIAAEARVEFRTNGIIAWVITRHTSGDLVFNRYNAATGAFIDSPLRLFAADGSVDVPAISGASQAAQVTAYDAALGRLAIGGIEMGNTGWRTIVSWDAAGNQTGGPLSASFAPRTGQAGWIRMRRSGSLTVVAFNNLQTAVSLSANNEYELLAAGILPTVGWTIITSGYFMHTFFTSGGFYAARWGGASGAFRLTPTTNQAAGALVASAIDASIQVPAPPAWPTSLPGSQATPPITG